MHPSKRQQEEEGEVVSAWQTASTWGVGQVCASVPSWAILVLSGTLTLVALAVIGRTEERWRETYTLGGRSPEPLDPWRCTTLVLNVSVGGAQSGLFMGVAAMATVWTAELLTASKGLALTMRWVPLMGLVIGAGAGAVEGVGRAAELLGPSAFWRAVNGGVRGAGVGSRVAMTGGVLIGGAMCALAAMAVRNVLRGGDMRVAPLMTFSVALGATRVMLSLAPEAIATGTFVGAVMGAATDLIVLEALGFVGVAGCLGLTLLKGVPVHFYTETVLVSKLTWELAGIVGTLILTACLILQLRMFSALVGVPVGAAMAFLAWRVGELVCQSVAKVVEELFCAISINVNYSPD